MLKKLLATTALAGALSGCLSYNDQVESTVLIESMSLSGLSSGSGVIMPDGTILTNGHVVVGSLPKGIKVTYSDGSTTMAEIVGTSSKDLALLKVEIAKPDAAISLGSALDYGDTVSIVGNPLGLNFLMSFGQVAHPNFIYQGDSYVLLDANVNHGNSGGPVFDKDGYLVAIVVALIPTELEGPNFPVLQKSDISVAIPIETYFQLEDCLRINACDPYMGE